MPALATSFLRSIKYAAFSAILALPMLVLPTQAWAIDESDKPAIEKIIRDYLLQNPQLLIEVQQELERQQQQEAKDRATKALTEMSQTVFDSPNQAVIGNTDGDVTVVEFFDYNCSFCQRAMDDMNALLANDNKLKFVLKELPILSNGSVEASRISTAVYRLFPEKYEQFHNELLSLNGQKDGNRALGIAEAIGLDIELINAEAAKDDVLDAFREVNDLATRLGINGTPSYVIGDEVVFGALGEQVLRGKIENVRKCGKTVCG